MFSFFFAEQPPSGAC